MADGPTIQKSVIGQFLLDQIIKNLKIINKFRRVNSKTPIVLMGYFNPIFQFG